jgi:mannose-6-phosphate isomerase-like protein (cupin superfamily)
MFITGRRKMSTPASVTNLQAKSHDTPDEVRAPSKTRLELVELDGYTIGRMKLEPGWRWSECIKPVAQTEHCQLSHVGYAVSGAVTIRMKDGTEQRIVAGDSYTIPPGHDAWVDGSEPFVAIEVQSADVFAKPVGG